MAAKRQAWTLSEVTKLIENYDKPIQELIKLFPKHSKPSIERKMTRLRAEGKIGTKSKETVKKAYQLRHENGKA